MKTLRVINSSAGPALRRALSRVFSYLPTSGRYSLAARISLVTASTTDPEPLNQPVAK